MKSSAHSNDAAKFLCPKGLARTGGLYEFLGAHGVEVSELGGNCRSGRVLRQDEITLRQAFNHRFQGVNDYTDASSKTAALEERATLLVYLYRLYAAGRVNIPAELQRPLQTAEVEGVLSTLRRLSVTSRPNIEALVVECERHAELDTDVLAHVMDPLLVRFLLSCGAAEAEQQLGADRLRVLVDACARNDRQSIQAWFDALVPHLAVLSRHLPQFLRSLVLGIWRDGGTGLEALAFETAVLDERLFADLGFESTRLFCSALRRITAPGCEVLDPYMNDEEIDAALVAVEAINQDELVAHFRKLASTYNTQTHRLLRRRVEAAAHPKEATPEPIVAAPAPSTHSARPWGRLFSLSAHAT
jgi:hypothetical protein